MFKLFKNLTKKDIILIIFCIIFISLQVYLDLKLPDYMKNITTLIQNSGENVGDIIKEGLYMLVCALGSLLSSILVGYATSIISADFSFNLRSLVFNKVLKFSRSEIKKYNVSSLITRTTNDITQMEMFLAFGLQMIIKAPIMAIWAISKIIDKSIEWSLLIGVCVVVLLIVIGIILLIVFPRFEVVQKLIDKLNNDTNENLSGIRVIRAFNAEEFHEKRFNKTNNDLTKNQMFNQKCFAILSPIMYLVMNYLTLGIYFIGAYLINDAIMSDKIVLFSNMVVFTSYGMQVIASFLMLAFIFMIWPRAQVSAKRINEVLSEIESIKDGSICKSNDIKGEIEFKNVSFKYPDADEYMLKDINFSVKMGEVVAIIGSTGSGKSSLVNLIPRFYDVTDGEVLVDGINVKDYTLEELHNKIGYVSQKAIMFTGSIKSNISFGSCRNKKPEFNKIKDAIRVAEAEDFVLKMDKGYNSHIARGGTNVSGGQKQRLSIARAIARDPEIFIFDDSFSALDYETDFKLRSELKKYTKSSTNIIVAQRIGTIINADKIIVLDKGKCVGIGTHKELLKKCKVYKEIAYSQLSKEELENA